jgi:hypothetical protein
VEAELPEKKKYEQDAEYNTGNDCALNDVGTNSEFAVPISVLLTHFDAMRNRVFTFTRLSLYLCVWILPLCSLYCTYLLSSNTAHRP